MADPNPFTINQKNAGSAPNPLGVDQGYIAQRPLTPEEQAAASIPFVTDAGVIDANVPGGIISRTGQATVIPRYYAKDALQIPLALGAGMIDLQARMVQAGLLDEDYYPGQWRDESRTAFEKLLGYANQQGYDYETMLNKLITTAQFKVGKPKSVQPNVITLTSEDDLRTGARAVMQRLYGGNLPEEDLNRFIGAYRQMEQSRQQELYNKTYGPQGTGEGAVGTTASTIDKITSPDAALEAQIRKEHPEQVAATQFGNAMDTIIGTFTGSRAGR